VAPLGYSGSQYGSLVKGDIAVPKRAKNPEKSGYQPSVLFICQANICRSPAAAGLFRIKALSLLDSNEWRVESAGTWGLDGSHAYETVEMALKERGIDVSDHTARTVDREMLGSFDLVLTMEKGQKEALRAEFPEFVDRIFLLSEMAGDVYDIHDPIGESLEKVRKSVQELDLLLDQGFERIVALVYSRKRS
jgi:protein-tyrosine-phosphatase